MSTLPERAVREIGRLAAQTPEGGHIATDEVRRLSARLYREIDSPSIDRVLLLCEALLETRRWESGVIAFDWAYRVRRQYTAATYDVFFRWLQAYVRSWGDCDDFCTHAFGELLRQRKELFGHVLEWTQDERFWVRRASAVVLIPAILRNDRAGLDPLAVADRLIDDRHNLVQKGYGWMLKCLSQVDREAVRAYLIDRRARMPRVAFRYALEKFDPADRQALMAL